MKFLAGDTSYINITTAEGTRQTHFVRWMDLNIEVRNVTNGGTVEVYSNTYKNPGTYDAEVYVYNSKSFFSYVVKVVVVQPVDSCDLYVDAYHEMDITDRKADVCMNRTKENGTHTYDMWDYADKWVLVTYEETHSPVYNVCHNYTTPGQYNVTLRCYNRYSYFSEKKLIYVQYPILNLAASTVKYHVFGNDVVIDWSYENGTEVTTTVTLDGNDVTDRILFTDGDQRRGNITNPSGDAGTEVGMHTVVISCTNFVSGTVTREVEYYVEKTIIGLSFSTNSEETLLHVRTETGITVVASVTDGSNITYTYNNGLTDVIEYSADKSETTFSAYQYTASQPDYYTVTMFAQNNVSNASASMTVGAENPLTSDIAFTNINVTDENTDVTFTISPTENSDPQPTSIVASFKYGDEDDSDTYTDVDVPIVLIPSSNTNHIQMHNYDHGRYTAEVFIRNNVSNLTLQTHVMVGLGIENFQVQLVESNNCFDPESPVQFTVSRTNGTNITHTYNWNDQTATDTKQELSFMKALTFPSAGHYDITVTASNEFDSVPVELSVKMVYDFPASIAMTTGLVVDKDVGIYTIEFTRDANHYSPTNASCSILKDDSTEAQLDLDLGSDHTQAGTFSYIWEVGGYDLGPFNYSVKCSTCNQNKSWTGTVFLQEFITNLQVSIDDGVATPGQNVCVTLTVDKGSHITFIANFGDNCTIMKYDEAARTAELCHAYETDDNHTIEVKAQNQLVNLTDSVDVIIQYPVTTLQLDVRGGQTTIAIPSGGSKDVTFDLSIAAGPTEGPTNAFCSWKAHESAEKDVMFATDLRNLQNLSNTFTYSPSDPIGNQRVNVTCSNLVSSMSVHIDLILQIPCTSAELRNSRNPIGIDKNMTYTVLLQPNSTKCSHVTVFYDFGDGNTKVQFYDGILMSDPSITYAYSTEDTYSPSIVVWNQVTSPNLTDTLSKDVIVLKSLIFEEFTFTYKTPQQWPANVTLNVNTTFPYIDTSVTFKWGVNDEETVVPNTEWPVERYFIYDGDNDVIGNVTLTVRAENNVSDIEWNGTLVIKQAPSGAMIVLDDYYRTDEDIRGQMNLTQGSHLKLEVTCLPIDGTTGCSESYTDSTDNTSISTWSFPLSFTQPGQYNIEVNASNEFGHSTVRKMVTVLKPLIFEDFTFTYTTPQQWPANVTLNVNTTFPYRETTVIFKWGINNNETVVPNTEWPVERYFPYDGDNNVIGNVTLTLRAENGYSDIEWNGTLVIKQAPSGAMVILDDYYRTDEDIRGQMNLTQGSHLKLEVTCLPIDGTTGCSESYTDSTDNTSIPSWSFPLSFTQPGQYNIEVNVSNEFGHNAAQKLVTIQNPIEGFTIRSEDDPNHVSGDVYTIPFMGSDTEFTMLLEVTNDCAFPPTDVIMDRFVDFPRDVENVTERNTSVVLNCPSSPFEVKRTFGEIGDYVIKVNVSNQISTASYTLYVMVLEPLDDGFNITVEPHVEPDDDGIPSYPIRQRVNITAAHGAIADYTHTFYWSYNCDDDKNPLDDYSENCNQETEYASGQDISVNDVLLRYSGIYRMTVKVTYPGIEPIYSTKKIRVRPVPSFALRIDKKNPNNTWSELRQLLTVYNLQDIKHLDFRFTSLHNEVTIGSWTIRWFIDGKEVSGSPTIDEPFEANGETFFAAPGDYSIQAKLDALPNVETPHDQLFSSSVIGLTVDSSVGICDVQVPASGFLNEKFKHSDLFECHLRDPQFCLIIFKMCEPLQYVGTGTCFSVTITDPDNRIRYHQNYGSIVGACGTDNEAIFVDRKLIYDDIQWPSGFDFDAVGQWKMIVETSITFKDNEGEDVTKSERSDKIVEVRCRPCNKPKVMLVNPQGEGSSVNNTRKYPRYVYMEMILKKLERFKI